MENPNVLNILLMIVVGGISGTIAARIVKGSNYGLIVNVLLGIAGAVVGGFIFDLLNLTPGKHITEMISKTFNVDIPLNFMGMIISSLVGAIIILILFQMVKGRGGRSNNSDRD